jgi:hypothetical protein
MFWCLRGGDHRELWRAEIVCSHLYVLASEITGFTS